MFSKHQVVGSIPTTGSKEKGERMKVWATYIPRRRNTSYFGEWPYGAGANKYVAAGLWLRHENGKVVGHLVGGEAATEARRLKLGPDERVEVTIGIEKA